MGKPTGFKEYKRQVPANEPVEERLKDYKEFSIPLTVNQMKEQGARCMDCGVPFCHSGCPLGNLIPDWNDLVYRDDWRKAIDYLHSTNNFPEFTGRICPAPCEESCVLGINEPPVTIKNIERAIIERAFAEGWVKPNPPTTRTGKKVAVIGSGPAGLACAAQLNKAGHEVTVFERADRVGGLMRYGIPDFKMEKWTIDRRVEILEAEGIVFKTGVNVGKDITADELNAQFDAVALAGGSTKPRDLPVEGRELEGVQYAMEFLPQQNKRVAGDEKACASKHEGGWWFDDEKRDLLANDKNVIVIGGGDTGSDCVGTSNRHGAKSVTQFELMPMPPEGRPEHQPWPFYPMKLRTSSSHEEGCDRYWSIMTKRFIGENGKLTGLVTVSIEWVTPDGGGRPQIKEIEGSEKTWDCELVLLAMGFVAPETDSIVAQLGCELDERGNVKASEDNYRTSVDNVYACGDMRRGQSLVVWAISEGREAARSIDESLMGDTPLVTKGAGDMLRA